MLCRVLSRSSAAGRPISPAAASRVCSAGLSTGGAGAGTARAEADGVPSPRWSTSGSAVAWAAATAARSTWVRPMTL